MYVNLHKHDAQNVVHIQENGLTKKYSHHTYHSNDSCLVLLLKLTAKLYFLELT